MLLLTGTLEPSTRGPHVEQVGWGVARQVARTLAAGGLTDPLLERVPELAEVPGWAAYAVFVGRDAVALALLHLDGERASYAGEVVAAAAPPGSHEALLVRALHDAHAAGSGRLEVPRPGFDLAAWPR